MKQDEKRNPSANGVALDETEQFIQTLSDADRNRLIPVLQLRCGAVVYLPMKLQAHLVERFQADGE